VRLSMERIEDLLLTRMERRGCVLRRAAEVAEAEGFEQVIGRANLVVDEESFESFAVENARGGVVEYPLAPRAADDDIPPIRKTVDFFPASLAQVVYFIRTCPSRRDQSCRFKSAIAEQLIRSGVNDWNGVRHVHPPQCDRRTAPRRGLWRHRIAARPA